MFHNIDALPSLPFPGVPVRWAATFTGLHTHVVRCPIKIEKVDFSDFLNFQKISGFFNFQWDFSEIPYCSILLKLIVI